MDWGIGHRVLYHRPAAIARWRFGKGVFCRSHRPDKKQTAPQTKHKRQGHLGCLPHHFHRLHPLLQVLGHGLVRQCELFNDLFGHGRVLNPQFQRRVFPLACHRIRRNLLLFHFRCELHPTLFHGHEVKDTPAFPQLRVQALPLVGTGFHGFHHGRTNHAQPLRVGKSLPRGHLPSGIVHHHHRTFQRRCRPLATCNMGGIGHVHVHRCLFGQY